MTSRPHFLVPTRAETWPGRRLAAFLVWIGSATCAAVAAATYLTEGRPFWLARSRGSSRSRWVCGSRSSPPRMLEDAIRPMHSARLDRHIDRLEEIVSHQRR